MINLYITALIKEAKTMTTTTRIYYPDIDGKFRVILSENLLKEQQRSETIEMLRDAEKRKQANKPA